MPVILEFERWRGIIKSSRPSSTTKGVSSRPAYNTETFSKKKKGKKVINERVISEMLYMYPDLNKQDERYNLGTNSKLESGLTTLILCNIRHRIVHEFFL